MSFNFCKNFINGITFRESDPINQSRLKMLVYCLIINLVFIIVMTSVYAIQGPELQLYRCLIALILCSFLIYAVWKWTVWQQVSHVVCVVFTLWVWSNLLVFTQGINLPTIQFVFLVMVYSYYVHGLRWGSFYSFINVFPVLLYGVFNGNEYFSLQISPQIISKPAFLFVTSYNFLFIIFLHFHLFRAFNSNFRKIVTAKDNLNTANIALEQAMLKLEETSKMKTDFLSTMSHELRTPLNGVIGLSNVILMENPREDQKDNLDILKFSAENLLLLINDILDLNKFESQNIELERIPFYLNDLINNSSGSLKLNATKKGLDFQVINSEDTGDKLLYSDPTRLTQVLMNLVNNAVKFTDSGFVKIETIVLKLTADKITVRFSVQDSGIGMDVDQQENIFEPFVQASKSTTRKFGGTGLGLPIVKKILKQFDSDIFMESLPEDGSHFWFDISFSYKTQQPQQVREDKSRLEGLKGVRVLVAEDNLVNIFVIEKMLSQWGIRHIIAKNGSIAVELLQTHEVDVVLMDLHMPVLDGYQAALAIRSLDNSYKANVPIIALTASVSNAVGTKVSEVGMDDYLAKPFNPEQLYEKLAHFGLNGRDLNKKSVKKVSIN